MLVAWRVINGLGNECLAIIVPYIGARLLLERSVAASSPSSNVSSMQVFSSLSGYNTDELY
jgi:hypothetical protein